MKLILKNVELIFGVNVNLFDRDLATVGYFINNGDLAEAAGTRYYHFVLDVTQGDIIRWQKNDEGLGVQQGCIFSGEPSKATFVSVNSSLYQDMGTYFELTVPNLGTKIGVNIPTSKLDGFFITKNAEI